jgi:cleavage stimulation factor subunit 3
MRAALMEYHSNKDQGVAVRIFELGFKSFPDSPDFIVRYVQFLLSVNDDNSESMLASPFCP